MVELQVDAQSVQLEAAVVVKDNPSILARLKASIRYAASILWNWMRYSAKLAFPGSCEFGH